ncbi:hypothetical protein TorRG33x02_199290 [Trema orientale]|uniref:Uncharacterized protein n=1 Tax=Trema orientale TaxID=63057 RepID=A0A2P5EFG8_TREOI|nr:hypothetical protein TorRG33x02_199290 [Trema orientale]
MTLIEHHSIFEAKTGHPSTLTPGAVGHVAKGQRSTAVPHHLRCRFSFCNAKYKRTAMNAVPASSAADKT